MMFSLRVILWLALHLLPEVKSSMVKLYNNGYEGIVIAINPNVTEDENLIQNIQKMVTEASTYLFHATKQTVYFRNVSILLPMTWKSKSEYLLAKQESYEQADVIVAEPYQKYGDDPYTLQYGQCGEKGQYIHFTPNFLLTDNLAVYGPRGRVFVHEWAHLRWGVFDEYNVDRPFYIFKKNTIEATRCSTSITGRNVFKDCQGGSCVIRDCRRDAQTGLYEAKCTFIPDKSQTAKDSIMFMQNLDSVTEFCTKKTHNAEAPNLQNKMCNHRSTWEIIKESDDFQNASPITGIKVPPHPTFSLLKSKQRVVCLVLDKSGSMSAEDRLIRLNQAAELYLIQIIERGSLVGMVVFDHIAEIKNNLIRIGEENAYLNITRNLPQNADGGTSICNGLKAGFQAITSSNQTTSGSEIVLLTDGEDNSISQCFEEVEQSGATIHTIALGPAAAKELETLSNMTGGHRFYANKDINGLIDAFSRISSRSGSISEQAIQLESKSLNVSGKTWVNGTVYVDSTIGTDTYFVVTWTTQKPQIILQDPKGKQYNASEFKEHKLNIRSSRLQIPGIAETGTWTYNLLNNQIRPQLLSVTMTTRARSPSVLPIIAVAHMSQNIAQYPNPATVYARVSQGFMPVLGVNVTAMIETEDGHQVTLELWDNGSGADTIKNDGIYSRYFTEYNGNGRYSLKVRVQARNYTAKQRLRQNNKSLYVPGYVVNGTIVLNPPRPEVKEDLAEAKLEGFSRVTSGGSFTVSGAPSAGNSVPMFPPNKITDLEAEVKEDHIHLSWTAPGSTLDKGKAANYIIRISKCFQELQHNFDNAAVVNTSGLTPKESGSKETFGFEPELFKVETGTKFYIAIRTNNEANLTSEVSNIASAIRSNVPQDSSSPALGTNISAVSLAIWGLVVILSVI